MKSGIPMASVVNPVTTAEPIKTKLVPKIIPAVFLASWRISEMDVEKSITCWCTNMFRLVDVHQAPVMDPVARRNWQSMKTGGPLSWRTWNELDCKWKRYVVTELTLLLDIYFHYLACNLYKSSVTAGRANLIQPKTPPQKNSYMVLDLILSSKNWPSFHLLKLSTASFFLPRK